LYALVEGEKMNGRRLLVTGGSGFIGGFTLEALINLGAEVVSFGRRPPESMAAPVTFVQGDVTDAEVLISTCQDQGIDTIVHLAGYGTTMVQSNPELGVRVNIMGMSNVLEAARMVGLKVVFTSSIAVYGRIVAKEARGAGEDTEVNPVTVYGAGKLLCEKMGQAYALNYNLKFVALRLMAVYGFTDLARRAVEHPTFSDHARRLIELPLAGQPVVVEKGGRQPCDFVYVKDVAQAIAKACVAEDLKHGVFNIGSGEVRTLCDFADIIRRYEPEADVRVGETPNPAYPFMGPVDISRAMEELDYKPTPFSECLQDYVELTKAKETF
jgi:UDP-glucose 4-epimerase/UDP-glucuronate 4-epimerase